MKISDMIALLAKRMSADGDVNVGINVGNEFKHIANSFTILTAPNEEGERARFLIFSDTPAEEMAKKTEQSQQAKEPTETEEKAPASKKSKARRAKKGA